MTDLINAIRDHLTDLPIQLRKEYIGPRLSWSTIWYSTEHLATLKITCDTIRLDVYPLWTTQTTNPDPLTIQIADPNLLTKIQEHLHDQIHKHHKRPIQPAG